MSDLRLLRDVIAWGRANGWTPRDRWPGDATVVWATGPDVEIGVPGRYVGVGIPDGDFEPHWSVFTQSANEVFVTSVVQAVNLLVDLDVLPVTLHAAYAAGQAAYEERIQQRIRTWNDDPQTRLEAFAIAWEKVDALAAEEAAR